MKTIGNDLTFKTFNWLKVNNTEILIPDLSGKEYMLESDSYFDEVKFNNLEYGISKDILKLNSEKGNLFRYYESEEDSFHKEIVNLELNDNYNELLDTHNIVAKKNSKIEIILNYSSVGKGEKFKSSVIKVIAEDNSTVDLFVVQNDGEEVVALESIAVQLGKEAIINVHQYELGSQKLYTNFQSDLIGEKSQLNLDSIYFGYGSRELNMLYNIIHSGKSTNSDILVNGALKGESYKNLKFTLDFKKGSTHSKGSEEEYVILLDDIVHALSVPILLAHEDDIEGNHAASSGKIDHNLMFYIMSRGFSEKEAETLIIQSKFSRAISKVTDEEIKKLLWDKVLEIEGK
ncbi:SufB/SufD family protein [Anaerosphaera multitolerans]|uniref:SufD family Fe-S cluster assembly protein n=1 Tax=Anaerosphaera multitolerans TaxID=2487351 RepID=A0A437S8S5_9FIRM|nr:SufD family Fe-S cluster assembly protein [Anaerosphaera multitolerans]RVU55238.1 SufD family Fe-S cluster assembly protein [Anaerosphaera multitolerans]